MKTTPYFQRTFGIRWLLCAVLLSVVLLPSANATEWYPLPDQYTLPSGINPEGITQKGFGPVFYVGSIANGGIYAFNAITGDGDYVVEGGAGRVAIGMDYDARSGLLYVAGGPLGQVYVYEPENGSLVAQFDVGAGEGATFVNDVKVTRKAVYITDSFRPVFYKIKLSGSGKLRKKAELQVIPLSGDYEFVETEGAFNANGIEADYPGHRLIIVNSATGDLYKVNPRTGDVKVIELDFPVFNGDGLLLTGRQLFVVQNFDNQIAVVELDAQLNSGEVVDVITSDGFDIPTTVANFGFNLLVVNAKFATPEATEFSVTRVNLLQN